MKFVNTSKTALSFSIDGQKYDVPVDGSCEIDDKISYVVAGRGLPMKPASEMVTKGAQSRASEPPPVEGDKKKKGG